MPKLKALITGVTGQDGGYLAEFLIRKGYKVFGLVRRSSSFNTQRIDHLIEFESPHNFEWERGDLSDSNSLLRALSKIQPDEIYHLAAQSHVGVSFEIPIYSFDSVATGSLRFFEAVKTFGHPCKVYNACSSEMYGSSLPPQNEETGFKPRSPYAIAKLASFNLAVNYREAYGMYICNGILFNHESPKRGETFVTRKITRAVSRIAFGIQSKVILGNINSRRDWGYALDFVEAMWLMLQQEKPGDYVIATGENHSVKEFAEKAFACIGVVIEWRGEGINEKGFVLEVRESRYRESLKIKRGDIVVDISQQYFRPTEVDNLLGDYSKAKQKLGWVPKTKFAELIQIMVDADLHTTEMLLHGTEKMNQQWRQNIV